VKNVEVVLFVPLLGVIMDNAAGLHDADVVYVDTNPEEFEALPATAVHRPVDLEVVTADKEGPPNFYLISNGSS
jgi:hypothetical protein